MIIRYRAYVVTCLLVRRDLFYLLDYVTLRSEKSRFEKKKKLVWTQFGEKFPSIGVLLFPLEKRYAVSLSNS